MTKHLKSLHIKNFRMLEDFSVERLGQVNLIVGKNNSGKTTVLEALEVFANRGHILTLENLCRKKDEIYTFSDLEYWSKEPSLGKAFHSLFFKKDNENYLEFCIGESESSKNLRFVCTIGNTENLNDHTLLTAMRSIDVYFFNEKPVRFFISIYESSNYRSFFKPMVGAERGWMSTLEGNVHPIQYSFIDVISDDGLSSYWDDLLKQGADDDVIEMLKVIDKRIQKMFFIEDGGSKRRKPFVRLDNSSEAVPLASLGYGVQRLLELSLKIHNVRNGLLLIDEFENGLHYSVQEKVWRMIFEMAQRLNIQVFATTHSRDCIEAFTKVANEHPVEGLLFRMGRSAKAIDEGKIIATIFDEAKLQRFSDMDMDVR